MNRVSRVIMDAYYVGAEYVCAPSIVNRRRTMRLARVLGALRSWFGYVGPRKSRGVFLSHMERAFPEFTRAALTALLGRFWFYHQLRFLDLFTVDRLPGDHLVSLIHVEGSEHIEEARTRGRGALVVTAHVGDARVCHVALGLVGFPVHLLSARYDDYGVRAREARLRSSRKYHAVHFLDEPLRWVHHELSQNNVVFMAISGYAGPRGHTVGFLGSEIVFSSAPARLSLQTGVPVIPAVDLVDGQGIHRVQVFPALEPPSSAASGPAFTRRLVRIFEDAARSDPAQLDWIWYVIRCQEFRGEVRAYEEGKAVRAADRRE